MDSGPVNRTYVTVGLAVDVPVKVNPPPTPSSSSIPTGETIFDDRSVGHREFFEQLIKVLWLDGVELIQLRDLNARLLQMFHDVPSGYFPHTDGHEPSDNWR